MAKRKDEKRTRVVHMRDKARRHREKRPIHLVPDLLAVGGVADWFMESQTIPLVKSGDYGTAVSYLITNATTVQGLKDPVLLEVGAIVAKLVGKKLGLNRIGTKGVKLF
jgi:hypothetical protein